jgi:hypothetical protein
VLKGTQWGAVGVTDATIAEAQEKGLEVITEDDGTTILVRPENVANVNAALAEGRVDDLFVEREPPPEPVKKEKKPKKKVAKGKEEAQAAAAEVVAESEKAKQARLEELAEELPLAKRNAQVKNTSPKVREMANKDGVDLSEVDFVGDGKTLAFGTGAGGKITVGDYMRVVRGQTKQKAEPKGPAKVEEVKKAKKAEAEPIIQEDLDTEDVDLEPAAVRDPSMAPEFKKGTDPEERQLELTRASYAAAAAVADARQPKTNAAAENDAIFALEALAARYRWFDESRTSKGGQRQARQQVNPYSAESFRQDAQNALVAFRKLRDAVNENQDITREDAEAFRKAVAGPIDYLSKQVAESNPKPAGRDKQSQIIEPLRAAVQLLDGMKLEKGVRKKPAPHPDAGKVTPDALKFLQEKGKTLADLQKLKGQQGKSARGLFTLPQVRIAVAEMEGAPVQTPAPVRVQSDTTEAGSLADTKAALDVQLDDAGKPIDEAQEEIDREIDEGPNAEEPWVALVNERLITEEEAISAIKEGRAPGDVRKEREAQRAEEEAAGSARIRLDSTEAGGGCCRQKEGAPPRCHPKARPGYPRPPATRSRRRRHQADAAGAARRPVERAARCNY